jgi:hypothetical protein
MTGSEPTTRLLVVRDGYFRGGHFELSLHSVESHEAEVMADAMAKGLRDAGFTVTVQVISEHIEER